MDWTTQTIEALLAPRTNYERKRPDRPRFSLEPTRALLRALDCEHPAPLVIQIGGSKGKGTTASYLSALLRRIGLRVGVYASPHAVTIRERIRIDGELGPPELLVRSVTEALRIAGVADYTRASTRLTAVTATATQALHLELREGEPLLRSTGVNVDPDRRPVEFGRTFFAGSRVTLTLDG